MGMLLGLRRRRRFRPVLIGRPAGVFTGPCAQPLHHLWLNRSPERYVGTLAFPWFENTTPFVTGGESDGDFVSRGMAAWRARERPEVVVVT